MRYAFADSGTLVLRLFHSSPDFRCCTALMMPFSQDIDARYAYFSVSLCLIFWYAIILSLADAFTRMMFEAVTPLFIAYDYFADADIYAFIFIFISSAFADLLFLSRASHEAHRYARRLPRTLDIRFFDVFSASILPSSMARCRLLMQRHDYYADSYYFYYLMPLPARYLMLMLMMLLITMFYYYWW